MIKDLVVALARGQDFAADYAVSVAATFGAHATGLALRYEPVIPVGTLGAVPVDLIELQREEQASRAAAAVARFEAATRAAGVSATTRPLDTSAGGAGTLFGRIARRFDLAVVGQAQDGHDAVEPLIVEGALFESGRPVIVVPYIQKAGLTLARTLVCWDGSRTAARAVGDAMPFLARSKAVDVVVVAEAGKADEVPEEHLVEHLERHGVRAEVKRVARGEIAVEDVILDYAADGGADFLVMGGYGHSRLRELVLGGVTRGILTAMTVPVLMAH